MVTCWLLIETIAISGSPAWRGAVASLGSAGRAALRAWASAGDVVRVDSAARTASATAGAHHRRIGWVHCAVVNRFVMLTSVKRPSRIYRRESRYNKHSDR